MKPITTITIILFFIAIPFSGFSHEGNKHKKDSSKNSVDSTHIIMSDTIQVDSRSNHEHDKSRTDLKVTAAWDDFPSIHPLIVHFAIVLIIVAAALQLLNLILTKKEIAWIITAILFVGVLTAWLAGKNFHPHTHGITDHAKLVLEQHDKWANWTINTGLVALVLQCINLFVFKLKRWSMIAIAFILGISAYSVSMAGHYGAQLVHIEGIGPQGKYLEQGHDH